MTKLYIYEIINFQVYLMKPSKPNKQLADLALFLSHVSHCFSDVLVSYPQQLIDLLKKFSTVLCPDMRMVMNSLVLVIFFNYTVVLYSWLGKYLRSS